MCGIAGIIDDRPVNRNSIETMVKTLVHRGPDGSNVYIRDNVALGHSRLSIIDLSSGGQPMSNADGSVWITFNGEIYNYKELRKQLAGKYKFNTNSDTEIIIHLYEEYGTKAVKLLRGMFAFGIYDFNNQLLFAARDHLGQKPFYYSHQLNQLIFASEIKALLACDNGLREINEEALAEYLSLRIITAPRSMFKNICKLAPAHYLLFKDGKLNIERYWQLDFTKKTETNIEEAIDTLDNKISEAVRYHLVSDVPVGAFLSGGLDSSLVVAYASNILGGRLATFSGDVPYKDFSEIKYTRIVSAKYNTDSHELKFIPSLIDKLPQIIWHLDEPSDSLSAAMFYISKLARQHVKVVLGGDGGDELFGGYDRYYGNIYASYYAMIPEVIRTKIFNKIIALIPAGYWYRSLGNKLQWIHQLSYLQGGARYSGSLSYFFFSYEELQRLLTDSSKSVLEKFRPEINVADVFNSRYASDLLDKMFYVDTMLRMPDHPVMILDRMTMASGLEARSPFLDHELMEYCASLPSSFKVRGFKRRYIQLLLAKKYLPPEIINRKKQGFASPLNYLLSSEIQILCNIFLTRPHLAACGYVDKHVVDKMLKENSDNGRDNKQRLWLLLNLELWYRMYIENNSEEKIREDIRHYEY